MSKEQITYERLHEVLHYDPKTGLFNWKVSVAKKIKVGDVAGCSQNGYISIWIDGVGYFAHRLSWLYVYGYFPENFLDHKDRVRHHNWIDNLREASNQCNQRNCGNRKDNNSGVKGVCWGKIGKMWLSRIKINNKFCHLGSYRNFHNAVCARLAGEQAYNWEGCDSSSPAYQYVKKHIQKGE